MNHHTWYDIMTYSVPRGSLSTFKIGYKGSCKPFSRREAGGRETTLALNP